MAKKTFRVGGGVGKGSKSVGRVRMENIGGGVRVRRGDSPSASDARRVEPILEERFDGKRMNFYEEIDPEKLKDAGYRFYVTHGSQSHRAFRTWDGLNSWLRDTGLELTGNSNALTEGGFATKGEPYELHGSYTKVSMSGDAEHFNEFGRRNHLRPSEIVDNGHVTRAYIRQGKHGNTIYYLNPNYVREELPWPKYA